MRIAVISDIHAALAPFRQALEASRAAGFDQLVLLGDLFTYGMEPAACADLAAEAMERDGAILVGGNHDQLYADLASGGSDYVDGLPDWIRESVDWTWERLGRSWPQRLDWIEEWTQNGLLLAHANPFGYGDWTYLADEAKLAQAAEVLERRGFRWGVFGHLHRARNYRSASGIEVHVVGSTGQPRDRDNPAPHWAMIDLREDELSLTRNIIEFDSAAHRAAILAEPGLSAHTKDMLCRYYS